MQTALECLLVVKTGADVKVITLIL